MEFYITKTFRNTSFETMESLVSESLKKNGFGIITSIDMQLTLKNKLGEDFRPYKILGACNPGFAFKALSENDKIGVLLPCNVCIQQLDAETIEVFAVNPLEAMQSVHSPAIELLAREIYDRLLSALNSL